jgi:hypothetical protein
MRERPGHVDRGRGALGVVTLCASVSLCWGRGLLAWLASGVLRYLWVRQMWYETGVYVVCIYRGVINGGAYLWMDVLAACVGCVRRIVQSG